MHHKLKYNLSYPDDVIQKMLLDLGLSEYETKVYLSLLDIGPSLAGMVAKTASVNRRNVYDALERLKDKGFISYCIKNNKRYYTAVSPEKILSLYQEKALLAKDMLPQLMKRFVHTRKEREVHVFEGRSGMKTMYSELGKNARSGMIIGSTGRGFEMIPSYLKMVHGELPRGFKLRELWNYDSSIKKVGAEGLTGVIRYLPKNFVTQTQIFIAGDKSAIVIWSEKPLGIMIIDKEISKGFKAYFEFLWRLSNNNIKHGE